MIEIQGNLWDYYGKPKTVVLITTNGFIKKNGEAVMGRGCALGAAARWPELPAFLGSLIQDFGNHLYIIRPSTLWTFPVKHKWWEKADLKLIEQSTQELLSNVRLMADDVKFILPRPGCGNGQLRWEEVKPVVSCLPDNVYIIDNSK